MYQTSTPKSDSPHTLNLHLPTLAATQAFAVALAGWLQAGDTVALHGGMGSGKTTLVAALVQALGLPHVAGSPTYTLVHEYLPKKSLKPEAIGLGGVFNASHPLPSGEGRVRNDQKTLINGRPSPAAPAATSPEGRGKDALLVKDEIMQRSPKAQGLAVWHSDWYRLEATGAQALWHEALAWLDETAGVVVVEWPERAELPAEVWTLQVTLAPLSELGEEARSVTLAQPLATLREWGAFTPSPSGRGQGEGHKLPLPQKWKSARGQGEGRPRER